MGVSFKVSKTGTRFRPKPVFQSDTVPDEVSENFKESSVIGSKNESSTRKRQGDIVAGALDVLDVSSSSLSEHEVSFTLNLYPDGYSIAKPPEIKAAHQAPLQDGQKLLHPYDKASETLFSAIESGRLPGDILDDIPCKYVNGTLVCEVQDYRKCASKQGSSIPSMDGLPIVNKVRLRMSLENVVKDIPMISDNSWTYGDLMEVESRILKALQPQLCLDPTPKLDRLCNNPISTKLNLDLSSFHRKRLRQTPEVTVTSNNRIHGKNVFINRVSESSNSRSGDSGIISGNVIPQHVQENQSTQNLGPNNMLTLRARSFVPDGNVPGLTLVPQQQRYQIGISPRSMQDQGSSLINVSGASPSRQDMIVAYTNIINPGGSLHGKRENQDAQSLPLSSFNKRARLTPAGPDGIQQQQMGLHMDSLHESEMNWKNSLLQQQAMTRGIQYANSGIQKYPHQMLEGVVHQNAAATSFSAGQPCMRLGLKEEQLETEKPDVLGQGKNDRQMMEAEAGHLHTQQLQVQQRLPQHLMRSNFPQGGWNNLSQDCRKEEPHQKRKLAQSPRLSTGLAHSPLSSKSGELSSGSAEPHFGATVALGSSQRDKSMAAAPSLTSSANDPLQRQHQAQVAAKRRSNSLPKTPIMSNVGSPASVSNISVPLNANSPSIGTPPMADQSMLERFAKIEIVTMRHQLNCKKNKVDDYSITKPNTYSLQNLSDHLSNSANNEEFKDDSNARQLSKSLAGGNMNICKTRFMDFTLPERVLQGNAISYVTKVRNRMIMSEKPNDGTVVMHYGEADEKPVDVLSAEDYLPTLPNTHFADLLATQFCSLMMREGYLVEYHIQPRPVCINIASSSQPNVSGGPLNNSAIEAKQYNETVSVQSLNDIKPTLGGNASINLSHNLLANSRMLPTGNPQALQISQSLVSGVSMPARPQQLDPQHSLLQQHQQQQQLQQQNQHALIQQQNSQFQRSPMVLPSNPLSDLGAIGANSNMQLGSHMVNKPSTLQLQQQLLQQQQQQQQQQLQQGQQQSQQPLQQQQVPQMQQRKMMMAMRMGSMGNNMVGLGGLGNAMSIGGARGIGTGISGPMAPITGMSNASQNPINLGHTQNINALNQQLRNGHIMPATAQMMKQRINRTSVLGGAQSGITGMSGARQMHPGSAGFSMLGQPLNRTNMNVIQRSPMGHMGPPKMMAGMNHYMQQQQLQQQQQQLQQQQQQPQVQQLQQQLQPQQHQQLLLQQQQETSSLQAVVAPSQVGSPSTMGIPQLNQQTQQQPSPQQMSQRTPMSPQLSSGAIHAISSGNPEAGPASPQLSSQTLGSVGSITNSPMELQAVNKRNSVSNA
ncbi:protein PHYTOCHROME-DEPENDENT LATE-FLOWERING [Populus nigra]|uniref:protein PHYTOCHROME-DEPENDENT LATE-FLOWERING n=1 Tax=Populus nigra TaxID=3691 RepID=UPI002B26C5BF|nr:protein PHYTOCHROME-DEPENDENT LATE-FLOWERING [Populus nigra]